jgi:hypothetical protein
MPGPGAKLLASLSVVLAALVFSPAARADGATGNAPAAPSAEAVPRIGGFEILLGAGYGGSTGSVRDLELAPYGATLALDLGYTFPFGLRLGAYAGYGFGRTVEQRRDALLDALAFDFAAESSSLTFGASFGYDVPLHVFVLRYSLILGGTSMTWRLHDLPEGSALAGADESSPATGFLLAPGVTLLWPHGNFVCGAGFNYLVQANGAIPPGFVGELLVGVKL